MKLPPASTKASNTRKDVGSSAVHPKTLPPKQSGETCNSECPSFLYCMIVCWMLADSLDDTAKITVSSGILTKVKNTHLMRPIYLPLAALLTTLFVGAQ